MTEQTTETELPDVAIQLNTSVTASNMGELKTTVLAHIDDMNTELSTDEDFAQAKADAKWCAETRTKMADAKQALLNQTKPIAEIFAAFDEIDERLKGKKGYLEKLEKTRTQERKQEIVNGANEAIRAALEKSNDSLEKVTNGLIALPGPVAVSLDTGKGKRNLKTFEQAINAARDEIVSDLAARQSRIEANYKIFMRIGQEQRFLYPDHLALVNGDTADLMNAIEERTVEYEADQQRRADEEAAKQETLQTPDPQPITQPEPTVVQQSRPMMQSVPVLKPVASSGPVLKQPQTTPLEQWADSELLPAVNTCPDPAVKQHLMDCYDRVVKRAKAS